MEFISKPVISCAGDENLLPFFESHCLGTLASHQVTWKHPKLSISHSVRLEACFTRFRVDQLQSNVKVLSSGRPVRPVGTFQPLLYIYVVSSNVTQYTSQGGRNAIGSWLGHLRARNVFDWLIVMVNSDPQYNTPKILQKSNVLDKIKSDFNVRTGDRQFLEVPAPNSVEERLFNESWNQLTYLIRKAIIAACMSIIVDYDVHLHMLADSRTSFTWDYFEYLDRKEELAHMYLFLGGHEHALHEYYEATELLSNCIQTSIDQGTSRPQWLNRLAQLSSSDDASYYICDYSLDVTNTEAKPTSRLKDRSATLFELKNYLLSRQASILCICDKLYEFPAHTHRVICSTLNEMDILKIRIDPLYRAVWILCICLNTLTNIRLDSNRSIDDINKSIIEVLDTAYSCNHILENISSSRITRKSLVNNQSTLTPPAAIATATATATTSTSQNIFLDARKDSNPTVWYMSHIVDKIYTHLNSQQNQMLLSRKSPPILMTQHSTSGNSSMLTDTPLKFIAKHKSSLNTTNTNNSTTNNTSSNSNKNDKDEKDTSYWTQSYAVELWLYVFNYLKQIGQMTGLWCSSSSSSSSIKSSSPSHRKKRALLNSVVSGNLKKNNNNKKEKKTNHSVADSSVSDHDNNNSRSDGGEEEEEEKVVDPLEMSDAGGGRPERFSCQDNSLLLAHNHVTALFNSSVMYSQIFIATGQTLVGFLKLIHNPKRAYEIVFDLADYLFSQEAYDSASWLYESIINFYDEPLWLGLITSARICLAWCLHLLCIGKEYRNKDSCEIAQKYIQICFTLSGTRQPILRNAVDHVYRKVYFWYQTSNLTDILRIPTYSDAIDPHYWWIQAVEFHNSLLSFNQSIITNPYDMSALFRLKLLELDGVCDCGYELISAEIESNSERSFQVSVQIIGSEPSYVDWQTLLNPNDFLPYHVMNTNNSPSSSLLLSQSDSQLHLVNLANLSSLSVVNSIDGTNTVAAAAAANNNTTNNNNNSSIVQRHVRSQLSIPSSTGVVGGSQLDLEQIMNKYLLLPTPPVTVSTCRSYSNIPDSSKDYKYAAASSSTGGHSNQVMNPIGVLVNNRPRVDSRLGSLLNVAASLASRPAWKSQDVLNDETNTSNSSTTLHKQSVHLRNKGRFTRIPSDGYIEPNGNGTPRIMRQYSLRPTRKRSFTVNGKQDIFGNEIAGSNTTSNKKPLFILRHESVVTIRPGVNKLLFVCNVPGFYIPEQISIICYDNDDTHTTEVNFASDIDGDVYGPNWRNVELMQTLLPKPEIALSSSNEDKPYPVVFGTCQPIPIRLRLGKLGLPQDCKLSTKLYRIHYSSNKRYNNNNTKAKHTSASHKSSTSIVITTPTHDNDENDIPASSVPMTSIANDYTLVSNTFDQHEESSTHQTADNNNNNFMNYTLPHQFILEDGPVDFIQEYNNTADNNPTTTTTASCKINHPVPAFPPGCCLRLSRPLNLSAVSCNDQFALSMPSGHYCILPVNIIKPLAFRLNMFPLLKSYIIFSLHIACVDTDPDCIIPPELYCSLERPCREPVTFELSNMRFSLSACKPPPTTPAPAPSSQHKRQALRSSSTGNQQLKPQHRNLSKTRSSPAADEGVQLAEERTTTTTHKNDFLKTGSVDKLYESNEDKPIESLNGDILDNKLTKAYVNHLTPFSIPWRFKQLEYNQFMKVCKEAQYQPIGRFECTMNRIGGTKINQQIRVDCALQQKI
ncbi:unnamed protein product [Trichobilharzia szidati]|nr:unnamed protein product [Trichobilharzia szidati]